jgi:hypothetical protein
VAMRFPQLGSIMCIKIYVRRNDVPMTFFFAGLKVLLNGLECAWKLMWMGQSG